MANEGKRSYCRCIQDMTMIIGKKEEVIFVNRQVYPCMVRTSDKEANYYKIYGEEFALSCSEVEFKEYFCLVDNSRTEKK